MGQALNMKSQKQSLKSTQQNKSIQLNKGAKKLLIFLCGVV